METFSQGIILNVQQISAHTYHLKVQSNAFRNISSSTLEVIVNHPRTTKEIKTRTYSFWNFEPIHQVADLAINTFSNGLGAEWVKQVQSYDRIYFKESSNSVIVDESAEQYLLMGDITSLAHLYEIHRNLAISKKVFSAIFYQDNEDKFPDLDQSYPFYFHQLPFSREEDIRDDLKAILPKNLHNTLAYIVGESKRCKQLSHFFTQEHLLTEDNIKIHPFY